MQTLLAHERLDRWLAAWARRPDRFARKCERLAAELDAREVALEITDPLAWRKPRGATRVLPEGQFRAEVESLELLEHEAERRLALRIEFARIRLDRAQRAPLAPAPQVLRRRREWHALRLEMVERNLYLVLINVERYRKARADRLDMMQSGAAALLRAVDGFDWRRGVLFRTYAVHWLNQGFLSHLYETHGTVHVPTYVQKAMRRIREARERLGGREAGLAELARATGLGTSTVATALKPQPRVLSLDLPLQPGEDGRSLAGEIPAREEQDPGAAPDEVSVPAGVALALAHLGTRERRIVELRFGIGCPRAHTFAEMAAEFGVSLERVRQIFVRALARMRTPRLRRTLEPLIG